MAADEFLDDLLSGADAASAASASLAAAAAAAAAAGGAAGAESPDAKAIDSAISMAGTEVGKLLLLFEFKCNFAVYVVRKLDIYLLRWFKFPPKNHPWPHQTSSFQPRKKTFCANFFFTQPTVRNSLR